MNISTDKLVTKINDFINQRKNIDELFIDFVNDTNNINSFKKIIEMNKVEIFDTLYFKDSNRLINNVLINKIYRKWVVAFSILNYIKLFGRNENRFNIHSIIRLTYKILNEWFEEQIISLKTKEHFSFYYAILLLLTQKKAIDTLLDFSKMLRKTNLDDYFQNQNMAETYLSVTLHRNVDDRVQNIYNGHNVNVFIEEGYNRLVMPFSEMLLAI
jgi:hypothetical protein